MSGGDFFRSIHISRKNTPRAPATEPQNKRRPVNGDMVNPLKLSTITISCPTEIGESGLERLTSTVWLAPDHIPDDHGHDGMASASVPGMGSNALRTPDGNNDSRIARLKKRIEKACSTENKDCNQNDPHRFLHHARLSPAISAFPSPILRSGETSLPLFYACSKELL